MEPKTVEILGQKERIGDWIVVDSSRTKVLATGSNPAEALRNAGVDSQKQPQRDRRPVLMQVTDPSATCLY